MNETEYESHLATIGRELWIALLVLLACLIIATAVVFGLGFWDVLTHMS